MACLGAVILAAPAQGQGVLRFVGIPGNDAGPCTRQQPCRTLQAGINATPDGGELQILNSGGYGGFQVTRSITISADGVSATVISPDSEGLAIGIDAPGATVVLRGLLVSGQGTGSRGIQVTTAGAVQLVGCIAERFTDVGIFAFEGYVTMTDTVVRENGLHGLVAVGSTKLTIDRSRFDRNTNFGMVLQGDAEAMISRSSATENGRSGFYSAENSKATMVRSIAEGNGEIGFAAVSGGEIQLEGSVARDNMSFGVVAEDGTVTVSNSVVTDNGVGIAQIADGIVQSRRNNTVAANGADTSGTIATLPGS